MKLCIHRGAREIGGTCIEIESQGKRILLDLGQPLVSDSSEYVLPAVDGLREQDSSLLGIVVSHAHLDHYGLISHVEASVPLLLGNASKKIINAGHFFFPDKTPSVKGCIDLRHQEPVHLGPFTLTPYLMDHSAYDSYAILVEAEGKRVFYSGDFRGHGRKSRMFDALVNAPPANIDALLMEGSTLGRDAGETYPSESQLENRFVRLIKDTRGMALVWSAAQNIDRIVTIYRACRKSGRQFIIDMYTASILQAIGNSNLPQPGWPDLRVFLPRSQKQVIRTRELFAFAKSFAAHRVYPEQLKDLASSSVLLFRPSMVRDIEAAGCLDGSGLIYSLWPGYLEEERLGWFKKWLRQKGIRMEHCHTSGHASITDLKRLAEALRPEMLVPVHTFNPEEYSEHFAHVIQHDDGAWWEV